MKPLRRKNFSGFFMGTIKNAPKAKAPNKAFVKAVALDKALEAYKYSQKIGVLQLAKEFEKYLLS